MGALKHAMVGLAVKSGVGALPKAQLLLNDVSKFSNALKKINIQKQ